MARPLICTYILKQSLEVTVCVHVISFSIYFINAQTTHTIITLAYSAHDATYVFKVYFTFTDYYCELPVLELFVSLADIFHGVVAVETVM